MTARPPGATGEPWYFAVSPAKLTVMSLVTLGVYLVYWLYQQWGRERARTGEDLSPFWRTFFGPVFAFSLFGRVARAAEETGAGTLAAPLWALLYLAWLVTWRLPQPYWLATLLSFVPLLPVQAAITRINAAVAPGAPRNDRYTLLNVVMIMIGTVLLLITVAGAFLPALDWDDREQPVNVSV